LNDKKIKNLKESRWKKGNQSFIKEKFVKKKLVVNLRQYNQRTKNLLMIDNSYERMYLTAVCVSFLSTCPEKDC